MAHVEREACEVYTSRSVQFQVWKSMVNWVVFFLQILMQMVPSFPHFFSYIRFSSSSSSSSSASSSSHAADAINSSHINFKPLPVIEIPLQSSSTSSFSSSDSDASVLDDDFHLRKLTIVLDLDETLVCAYETSSLPEIVRTQAIQAGLKWFELECVSSDKEWDGKPKINYVTVFERPGLHDFLKGIAEFANLVLFTAGLEDYARPLVDRIDKDNLISVRLYRPSTVSTTYREHVKDLSYISKDLRRIVIVDNNPFSFLLQPLNGIPCIPFSAGQPYDDQLLEVLLPLLKHLSLQKDVRPVLHERFRMPEWFQMHGIPASAITRWAEENTCEQTQKQQQLR